MAETISDTGLEFSNFVRDSSPLPPPPDRARTIVRIGFWSIRGKVGLIRVDEAVMGQENHRFRLKRADPPDMSSITLHHQGNQVLKAEYNRPDKNFVITGQNGITQDEGAEAEDYAMDIMQQLEELVANGDMVPQPWTIVKPS